MQSQSRTYNELKASTFKSTTLLPGETLWSILQDVMLYCLMNLIKNAGVQGHSHNLRNTEAALSNPENKPQMFLLVCFHCLFVCFTYILFI